MKSSQKIMSSDRQRRNRIEKGKCLEGRRNNGSDSADHGTAVFDEKPSQDHIGCESDDEDLLCTPSPNKGSRFYLGKFTGEGAMKENKRKLGAKDDMKQARSRVKTNAAQDSMDVAHADVTISGLKDPDPRKCGDSDPTGFSGDRLNSMEIPKDGGIDDRKGKSWLDPIEIDVNDGIVEGSIVEGDRLNSMEIRKDGGIDDRKGKSLLDPIEIDVNDGIVEGRNECGKSQSGVWSDGGDDERGCDDGVACPTTSSKRPGSSSFCGTVESPEDVSGNGVSNLLEDASDDGKAHVALGYCKSLGYNYRVGPSHDNVHRCGVPEIADGNWLSDGVIPTKDQSKLPGLSGLDNTSVLKVDGADLSQADSPARETQEDLAGGQTSNLDEKQQSAVDLFKKGCNVFVTGKSGTGKSHLLKTMFQAGTEEMDWNGVVVGPTNICVSNLGEVVDAKTIHKFLGMGIPSSGKEIIEGILFNRDRCLKLDFLIFDEIGMVNPDFLDWMDQGLRRARNIEKSFGGIRVAFFGDFAQLPPIPGDEKNNVEEIMRTMNNSKKLSKYKLLDPGSYLYNVRPYPKYRAFAFQSVAWREASFRVVVLKKNYRQSEEDLIDALDDLRRGYGVSPRVLKVVGRCSIPLDERGVTMPEGIEGTNLHAKNEEVDNENRSKLQLLEGSSNMYRSHDHVEVAPDVSPDQRESVIHRLERNSFYGSKSNPGRVPQLLELKVGAQVMATYQISADIVSGSRGVVKDFKEHVLLEEVKISNHGSVRKVRVGKERDMNEILKNSGGTKPLLGSIVKIKKKEWKVLMWVEYPVVEFLKAPGVVFTVLPVAFELMKPGEGKCVRLQVPLILAWALTYHKVQGMQVDYLVIDTGKCWDEGQVYVGIGRCTNSTFLLIKNYDPSRVKANVLALGFHAALEAGEKEGGEGVVDRFLEEKAGLWFFPLLNHEELLRMLMNERGMCTRVFNGWVHKYAPSGKYGGFGCRNILVFQKVKARLEKEKVWLNGEEEKNKYLTEKEKKKKKMEKEDQQMSGDLLKFLKRGSLKGAPLKRAPNKKG